MLCDCSPNVLLSESWSAKLADVGVAKHCPRANTVASLGTLAWMSPEQMRGDLCGPATDIYSFGVVRISTLTNIWTLLPKPRAIVMGTHLQHIFRPERNVHRLLMLALLEMSNKFTNTFSASQILSDLQVLWEIVQGLTPVRGKMLPVE